MTPERWHQITNIFEEASQREPNERAAFLAQACRGDEDLNREVAKLLRAHEQAGDFLGSAAVQRTSEEVQNPSLVGRQLGPYQLLSLVGAGGMGEVYRAKDTRLNRTVAIKILPSGLSNDAGLQRRFEREARAVSQLNHPNICTLHDVGNQDGVYFLVMEYLQGETLAQRLEKGPLPSDEALQTALGIAGALEEAHRLGILHRDLKPANVVLTRSGAKLLDFGLAKWLERPHLSVQGLSKAETVDDSLSVQGTIQGTVSYMSPEQAEGKELDARSDIFSFGAVLYETVTGRKPFQGASAFSILGAIIREEPKPPSEITGLLPAGLESIILRCLRKEREYRWQTMGEVGIALLEVQKHLAAKGPAEDGVPRRNYRRRLAWASVAVLASALVGGIIWVNRPTGRESQDVTPTVVPLTTYSGTESEPSFSPDGNQVVFSWDGEKQDNRDIYVKLIGSGPPLRLTHDPAVDRSPAWSPDGRWIAFCRRLPGGRYAVVLVSPIGGPERTLAEMVDPGYSVAQATYLSWTPDSRWLAMVGAEKTQDRMGVMILSIESGERRRLTSPPANSAYDGCPTFSPDGRTLAFCRWALWSNSDLFTVDLSQDFRPVAEPKRITSGNWIAESPVWTADGRSLIFSASEGLWRVDASGKRKPERLAVTGTNSSDPAISPRGNRLAFAQGQSNDDIWRIEIPGPGQTPKPPQKFIASTRAEGTPDYSPDGKKISFLSDRSGSLEIWVCDADGSNPVQLTSLGGPLFGSPPRWSPDSNRLTFGANIEGHSEVYVIGASGGSPRRLTTSSNSENPTWTSDGRWILFDDSSKGICKVPAEGGPAVPVPGQRGWYPVESPDGKFLYTIEGSADGRTLLFRSPVGGAGATVQLLDSLLQFTYFAVAREGVYFIPRPDSKSGYSIQFLNAATGTTKLVASIEKPPCCMGLAVSPDGRWILYPKPDQSGGDLMLVENFR